MSVSYLVDPQLKCFIIKTIKMGIVSGCGTLATAVLIRSS